MIQIQVTEEQNRAWHRANIRASAEFVEQVKRENAKRLMLAEAGMSEAREWALRESLTTAEVDLIEAEARR